MTNKLKNAFTFYRYFSFELQSNADCSNVDLSDLKDEIMTIADNSELDDFINYYQDKDSDYMQCLEILKTCLSAVGCDFNDLESYEFFDLMDELTSNYGKDDFYIDSLPCGECRLIHIDEINEIWHDELINTVKECYDLSDVPDFVVIDWDATAANCKIDGKGHHFACYDHEEHTSGSYYIFRIN